MDIYLDANATTPVLAQARAAALNAMADDFGNPSSVHNTGLKARALVDAVRDRARRVLGAATGQLLFVSGATEGIQTAVLSALNALRTRRDDASPRPTLLLYGATDHKAVPEALKHWNDLLGLGLDVQPIPVDHDGRHDLAWLRRHAPRAGLVCTMAANNETGVISDLDGIADALAASPALWMVDGVQALGKLPLRLAERRIDYAPFSGHKLYAPKGIGLLYVREGAPFTPLMAGGGQEGALRSGTENMSGIAAFGAVLEALETGGTFRDHATLVAYRDLLCTALRDAFPGLVLNAPPALSLPTTLNFSVPGVGSKLLMDLFDAADMRVSGGSACSAAKARPSYVLEAMGLPAWQVESAIRLSFGPAADRRFIDEACDRIRACGESLRESCLGRGQDTVAAAPERLTRFVVDGACCYLLADAASRCCVVIDPLPALTERLAQWIRCQGFTLVAALDTRGDRDCSGAELRIAVAGQRDDRALDALGWPVGESHLALGAHRLTRTALADATAYLLHDPQGLRLAFVGDALTPRPSGARAASASPRDPLAVGAALRRLAATVEARTLLLPGQDDDNRFADTIATLPGGPASVDTIPAVAPASGADANERASLWLTPGTLHALLREQPHLQLVDVREPYEQRLRQEGGLALGNGVRAVPLSSLTDALADWIQLPPDTPVVFFCRSGNRSAHAARSLRRLGHAQAFSLAGGLALWPAQAAGLPSAGGAADEGQSISTALFSI